MMMIMTMMIGSNSRAGKGEKKRRVGECWGKEGNAEYRGIVHKWG